MRDEDLLRVLDKSMQYITAWIEQDTKIDFCWFQALFILGFLEEYTAFSKNMHLDSNGHVIF